MDLSFSEEQVALRDLARQIFEGHCTDDRLREIDAGPDRFDAVLWEELARANLLGVAIPENLGGIGGGMIEVAILLEEAGRVTAPVPLWASVLGALALARGGSDEQKELVRAYVGGGKPIVVALMEPNAADPFQIDAVARRLKDGWYVDGVKTLVPRAPDASAVVLASRVDDGTALFALDPDEAANIARQEPKGSEPTYEVELAGSKVEPLSGVSLAWLAERAIAGVCAEQVGVAERALELTASYSSERQQFAKPLGAFQAVQQRAADAYIDVQAMRWTMWEAAWRLSEGLDATEAVGVATVWATEAGGRVLAAAQHLHGGMGVDMDYPLHRYTFAARQLGLRLGSAPAHLYRLGELIAT